VDVCVLELFAAEDFEFTARPFNWQLTWQKRFICTRGAEKQITALLGVYRQLQNIGTLFVRIFLFSRVSSNMEKVVLSWNLELLE